MFLVHFLASEVGWGLMWADVLGFVFGVACIVALGRGSIWNFAFGISWMACFAVATWTLGLYANFGLALTFVALNAYGWVSWMTREGARGTSGIRFAPPRWRIGLALVAVGLFAVLVLVLRATSSHPYLDSLTTALSLVAQFMIARKFVENWFLWLAADTLYVLLFLSTRAWSWLALYALYLVLSTRGMLRWLVVARST